MQSDSAHFRASKLGLNGNDAELALSLSRALSFFKRGRRRMVLIFWKWVMQFLWRANKFAARRWSALLPVKLPFLCGRNSGKTF